MKKGGFLIVGLLALGLWADLAHGQAALTLRRTGVVKDSVTSNFTVRVGDTFSVEVYMLPQGEAVIAAAVLLTVDDYFDIIPQAGGVPFRAGQIGGSVSPNAFMAGDGAGNPGGNNIPGYQVVYSEGLSRNQNGVQPTVQAPVVLATMQLRAVRRPRTGSAHISVDLIRSDGGTGYYVSGQGGSRHSFSPITNATITILGFTISPLPDIRLLPGGADTLNLNKYVDAASVTWTATQPDSIQTQINAQTSFLSFLALPGFLGKRDVTVTATDPGGDSLQDTIQVIVSAPPVILKGSLPDTIRFAEDTVDTTLSLTGKARDPDSSRVPLMWKVSQGKADTARIDVARGNRLILTPKKDFNGTDKVQLTVSNQYGLKDSTSVPIVVTPVNDPPEFFRGFPKLTLSRDTTLALDDYIRDVDNSLADPRYLFIATSTDSILLTVRGLKLMLTPIPGWPGDKKVTVTAVDPDGGRNAQVLNVTVTPTGPPPPPGQPPVVKPPVPDKIGVVSGGAQVALPLDPLVTDPDTPKNQIRWTVKGNTDMQVNIDTAGGQNRALFQAPATFIGFELVTFTATDPTNLSGSFQMLAFSVQPSIPDVGGLPDTSVVAGGRTPYVDFDDYMFDSNDPDSALVVTPVSLSADLQVTIDPVTHQASIQAISTATLGMKQVVFEVRNRTNKTGLDTIQVRVDPAGQVRLSDFPQVAFRSDQTGTLKLDDYVLSGGASRLVWTPTFNTTRLSVTIDANRVATFRSVGGFSGQDIVTLSARDPLNNSQSSGQVVVTVQPLPVTIKLKALPNVTFASGGVDRSLRLNNYVETAADTSRLTWTARLLSGKTNTLTVFIDPTTHFVTLGSASGFTGQETVIFTAKVGADSAATSALVTVVPAGSMAGVLKLVTVANPVQRAFVDVFVSSKQELASDPTVILELNAVRSLIPMQKITVDRVGDIWSGNLVLQIGKAGSGRLLASAVSKLQIALTDTARFTVGTTNPGFALTVSAPGASLTMPSGAFREAAVVALVQSKDGDPGTGAAKPVAAGLIPASEAYLAILSETPAQAGEIRFEVAGVGADLVGKVGVYRKDGDAWAYVGSQKSEVGSQKFVSAPILQGGIYRAMVSIGDETGSVPQAGEGRMIPKVYELSQNYPNPFNPATSIRLSLPEAGAASLRVYDLAGRLVRTLVSGAVPAGGLVLTWDGMDEMGRRVASGVYLYRLEAPGVAMTKKMMLLK